MIRLSRRREVRLPTVWGWLLIAIASAALLWLGAGHVVGFLALDAPARGADALGARTLVVEGWLEPAELDAVPTALRGRRYERVLTTGGPVATTWGEPRTMVSSAERAADYLRRQGAAAGLPVIAVPAPASAQDRTFLSAVMLREWAARSGTRLGAIDLYTAGVHARRSRTVFRLALGADVEVGVRQAHPAGDGDGGRWWASSAEAKTVLGEAIGLAWTTCCFWPPPAGSHEERWARPAPGR